MELTENTKIFYTSTCKVPCVINIDDKKKEIHYLVFYERYAKSHCWNCESYVGMDCYDCYLMRMIKDREFNDLAQEMKEFIAHYDEDNINVKKKLEAALIETYGKEYKIIYRGGESLNCKAPDIKKTNKVVSVNMIKIKDFNVEVIEELSENGRRELFYKIHPNDKVVCYCCGKSAYYEGRRRVECLQCITLHRLPWLNEYAKQVIGYNIMIKNAIKEMYKGKYDRIRWSGYYNEETM